MINVLPRPHGQDVAESGKARMHQALDIMQEPCYWRGWKVTLPTEDPYGEGEIMNREVRCWEIQMPVFVDPTKFGEGQRVVTVRDLGGRPHLVVDMDKLEDPEAV